MGLNDEQHPLQIDVTDETAFKVGVVQILQLVADRTACLPDLKKKVDKHEQIVQIGKYAAIPALIVFETGIKAFFRKILGW